MADGPEVREIGRVDDGKGNTVIVGVDRDTVTLTVFSAESGAAVTLTSYLTEEFAQASISACWQAGGHQGRDGVQDGGT